MPNTTCKLNITPQEYKDMQSHEAVCICTYEHPNGEQSAELMDMGTLEEMEAEASNFQMVVRWNHDKRKCLGKLALPVTDLLPPDEPSHAQH